MRWIVPFAVGGGYSMYSRLVAPFLQEALGIHVVVENRPGAGGIAGARTIASARSDGRTIGIVNASGLLIAELSGMRDVPSLTEDFTILGRIATTQQIWATARRSGIGSIDEAIRAGESGRLVAGMRDVANSAFVNLVVTGDILGIKTAAVVGYSGTPDQVMASLRGEADVAIGNFESLLPWIESGDLLPILQISDSPIADHPSLANVPTLGGRDGLAARRAAAGGRGREDAIDDASALAALISGGRIVVAPRGLDAATAACLRQELDRSVNDRRLTDLASGAHLTLDPAPAPTVEAELSLVAARLARFAPLVRAQIKRMRE